MPAIASAEIAKSIAMIHPNDMPDAGPFPVEGSFVTTVVPVGDGFDAVVATVVGAVVAGIVTVEVGPGVIGTAEVGEMTGVAAPSICSSIATAVVSPAIASTVVAASR